MENFEKVTTIRSIVINEFSLNLMLILCLEIFLEIFLFMFSLFQSGVSFLLNKNNQIIHDHLKSIDILKVYYSTQHSLSFWGLILDQAEPNKYIV